MTDQFKLRKPCKNCPFQPTPDAITFSCKERAEEIAKSAYRNGFPCHLSATNDEDDNGESGGYVFGPKTQHCAGAVMMFIKDSGGDPWPGIGNDDDLATRLEKQMDWTAPHFESEEDFIAASPKPRPVTKRTKRPISRSTNQGKRP